jgi:hypothetical protein
MRNFGLLLASKMGGRKSPETEYFEKELEKYITYDNNSKIKKIDWTGLCALDSSRSRETYNGLIQLLENRKMITPLKKGAYVVLGDGMIFSPDHNNESMGFSRKQDAEGFMSMHYRAKHIAQIKQIK